MGEIALKNSNGKVILERIKVLSELDIESLCEATEATIADRYGFSIGFNRSFPLARSQLEAYFRGSCLIPQRQIIIARFDGSIAGSIQLVFPSSNNQTSSFACSVDTHFVAPWARGHGIAKMLLQAAEKEASECGFKIIKLSVRSNMEAAIKLYESLGYNRWGTLDKYEMLDNQIIAGHFYCKDL